MLIITNQNIGTSTRTPIMGIPGDSIDYFTVEPVEDEWTLCIYLKSNARRVTLRNYTSEDQGKQKMVELESKWFDEETVDFTHKEDPLG
jgi:hypothetical protein